MATISEQKLEQRRWIAAWFESYIRTLTRDELERQFIQAVRDLGYSLPLRGLKAWRAKLEDSSHGHDC